MPRILITTTGNDVQVSIETEGKLTVNNQVIEQKALPMETIDESTEPAIRYNATGQRLASDRQRSFLEREGQYRDDMTASEAYLLIHDIMEKKKPKLEEKKEEAAPLYESRPLPWEEPVKRKRGRPRKIPLTL